MKQNINEEPAVPLSRALFAALPSWTTGSYNQVPVFLRESSLENPMHDETRGLAVLLAAAVFAARALRDWDGKRSPKTVAAILNGIEKAQLLVATLDEAITK